MSSRKCQGSAVERRRKEVSEVKGAGGIFGDFRSDFREISIKICKFRWINIFEEFRGGSSKSEPKIEPLDPSR